MLTSSSTTTIVDIEEYKCTLPPSSHTCLDAYYKKMSLFDQCLDCSIVHCFILNFYKYYPDFHSFSETQSFI